MSGVFGAEVSGIDLSQPLDDQSYLALRQAFLDHQVLAFRDQKLTIEQHIAFGCRFGQLSYHPYYRGLADYPEVMAIVKEPEDRHNNGGGWHADLTFLERPPLGSILRLTDVPARGGDTLFANLHAAYEALSVPMQQLFSSLRGVHSSAHLFGPGGLYAGREGKDAVVLDTKGHECVHPLVRTHPETGRKSLFCSPGYIIELIGLEAQESTALLTFLTEHCRRGEFTTRVRWQPDTMVFWDNRCTLHYALNDYHGMRRAGLRVSLEGDRPR